MFIRASDDDGRQLLEALLDMIPEVFSSEQAQVGVGGPPRVFFNSELQLFTV